MGLLQKLLSTLGLGGTESPASGQRGPGDVDVTVEREPSTESEAAVKGTETATDDAGAAETDVESTEEPEPTTDETTADEAATADTEDESTDVEDAADDGTADVPVTEINGIGPAYGSRLEDAGVENVADLAGADAIELAEATDISESRIEGWIDAAAEY